MLRKNIMIKYLLIFVIFLITSCSTTKQSICTYDEDFSFKDQINQSIIDGFYNGDTTGISRNIYLLK